MAGVPISILVIDDEERIRQLLEDFLEDYDEFSVRAVASAEEALVELARKPADLCIVDVRLPGMNGQEFILAAQDSRMCGRFVLHTGSINFSLSVELLRRGLTMNDVFLKPCDMNGLLARIRVIFNQPGD